MRIEELINDYLKKMSRGETFQREVVFVAQCGEKNPIQRFYSKEGYPYKCRSCENQSFYKTLLLSPKREVEGFFGPVYHCESCVPDLDTIAVNADLFYGLILGNIK